MNSSWIRKALLFSVITGASLAMGCGGGVEGKYRDPSGGINVEFKGGKAYIALGAYAVDGTYKVEGNKIIARGDFGMEGLRAPPDVGRTRGPPTLRPC